MRSPHYWFETLADFEKIMADAKAHALILPADEKLVVPHYAFSMLMTEHWVIGPDPRG